MVDSANTHGDRRMPCRTSRGGSAVSGLDAADTLNDARDDPGRGAQNPFDGPVALVPRFDEPAQLRQLRAKARSAVRSAWPPEVQARQKRAPIYAANSFSRRTVFGTGRHDEVSHAPAVS